MKHNILVRACQATVCTRLEPAKFVHSLRHPQKEEDIYLGIMENEEPVDTVHKWAMEHEIPKSMEKEVVDLACKVANCTRQRALLYERDISYDGVSQGTIMVYDGEEPADVIHKFCQNKSLPNQLRDSVIQDACKNQNMH